jgi:hypothetical protein
MSLNDLIGKIDSVDAIELTTRALEIIGKLANRSTLDTAFDAVRLIRAIYLAVVDAAAEKITAADAHKALDELEAAIRGNDSVADAEIDKKFGDA